LGGDHNEWFLLFDEGIAWATSLQLRHLFILFYYSAVSLMLKGCSKGISTTSLMIFHFEFSHLWATHGLFIPAEYLHIWLLQDFILMFGKMDLLKPFNFPSRPIPTGDYWATGFFSKKYSIDKNASKVRSRDSY
jgi:hypothetical protein